MHRLVLGVGLAVLGTGCSSKPGADLGSDPPSPGPVGVTLLHYNDLHAHLTPHADLVPDAEYGGTSSDTRLEERGGMARLATLVAAERARHPGAVLMNVGDTYHGGVEALFTSGNAIVEPMKLLAPDVGVPGNWDFAFGPASTRLRYTEADEDDLPVVLKPFVHDVEIEKAGFPNLAANVTDTLVGDFLPATTTLERSGVRIGFVGLTSDIVPEMHRLMALGFEFVEGEADYLDLVETHARQLRDGGADVVVVMSELGLHKDHQLAGLVEPGLVDVFFSAHTHEATFEPLAPQGPDGPWVVEAGNDGYLGRMELEVEGGTLVGRRWELMPIGADVAPDPEMAALVDEIRAPFLASGLDMALPGGESDQHLTEPIDTVVGYAVAPVHRRHVLDNPFNRAMGRAMAEEGGTELAITPGFRFDAVILEDDVVADGTITLEDAYRFLPAPYTLSTGRIDGATLEDIVESNLTKVFSRDAFSQGGGWVDGFSGLAGIVDMTGADGARVVALSAGGGDLDRVRRYTVTGASRPMDDDDVLSSYDGFTDVEPLVNSRTGNPWTPVDLLVEALGDGPLDPGPAALTDSSGTALWPEGLWVQPVWTE